MARSRKLAESTDWGALARRLQDLLKLGPPPIGITFRDRPASGIPAFEDPMPAPTPDGRTGRVPAGCVFWMEATDKLFTTEPADHRNCSVGSLTHGLLSPEEAAQSADVAAMIETGWIPAEALGQLPSVEGRPVQVVYGPLAGAAIDPDVVLIRIEAKQAMVLSDALPDARFEGKPQCHIIPLAKEDGEVAISVGCMASRVRTGMKSAEMTCALPAARLPEVVEALEGARGADEAIARYAADDKTRFKHLAVSTPAPSVP